MASSASTASSFSLEKGQWEERGQAKTENDNLKKKPRKPPVPARMGTAASVASAASKHCINHHQRKPQQQLLQQPLKQQSPGNGGHANDITEDYSDSDLEEPLLIYKQLNPCSLNNLKWYPTLKTKTKILPSQFLLLTNYNPQKMHSDVTHIMNKPKINKNSKDFKDFQSGCRSAHSVSCCEILIGHPVARFARSFLTSEEDLRWYLTSPLLYSRAFCLPLLCFTSPKASKEEC